MFHIITKALHIFNCLSYQDIKNRFKPTNVLQEQISAWKNTKRFLCTASPLHSESIVVLRGLKRGLLTDLQVKSLVFLA